MADGNYAVLAEALNFDFVNSFASDIHNLLNVLGASNVQIMPPGSAFRVYKTKGTANVSAVGKAAEIPNSNITMEGGDLVELTYTKARNLTGIEDIGKMGYEVAVGGTNQEILGAVQANIRKSIYTGILTGTGSATASDFQSKIATAAAYVAKKFEDIAYTPICFVSPDDAFAYLGAHNVTVEQEFGLSYLKNFMGLGNVIIDSNVPAGKVIGTAAENLNVVAADVSGISGIDLVTDASGLVGIHNGADYSHGAIETVAYCGVSVIPTVLDRIVIVDSAA